MSSPQTYSGQPQTVLPYNTPQGFQPGPPQGFWQDGGQLIVTSVCSLPDRCVKCNAPAEGHRLRKTIYWHEPWLWVTILAGVLVYAILAMILRKKAVIDLGLCPVHRARRNRWGWITGGICALGIGMFVAAGFLFQERATEDYGALAIVLGIVTLLVAAVVGSIAMRVLKPTKIDDRYGWFKGVGRDFLASLPPAR